MVLLVGLNSRQGGKLERPIRPTMLRPIWKRLWPMPARPRVWEIVVVSASTPQSPSVAIGLGLVRRKVLICAAQKKLMAEL